MQLTAWMYDIAREQSPRTDLLDDMLARSANAGYNAVGLYLEHRFQYASAPWAAAPGSLAPSVIQSLGAKYTSRSLRVIPFLNTLGHMEGFIHSEGGQWLAEDAGIGLLSLQSCPSRPECVDFARGLIRDVLAAFEDEWVHLGGDEAQQLGKCPRCAERAAGGGASRIYGEYYGLLCREVLARGRRPCLWADMLLEHTDALKFIPRETVLFDWQYFNRPAESTARLRDAGFDVVCCPSIQTYNSAWCFLDASQRNIDEHAEDAHRLGALGVMVTTWEFAFYTQYRTTLPLIYAAGRRLARGDDWTAAIIAEGGADFAAAAQILGVAIPSASAFLRVGSWRQLRDRLVMRRNPFYLWQDWREEACGPVGDRVLALADEAASLLPGAHPLQFAIELHRVAVEWVRGVQTAHEHYVRHEYAACERLLVSAAKALNWLRPGLLAARDEGGSAADPFRLDHALRVVRRTIERVRAVATREGGAGASRWRPAFETLCHDGFMENDWAAWRSHYYK
ncbi:MAG: family 20 glycosylhydrolase [Phycisphaerales bacterium]|nr:family 20 glycosylhydrolase [Phycisphaerales bacterium]